MRIAEASLSDPAVQALVAFHQQDMNRVSPPGTSFALDLRGLSGPEVTILGAWEDRSLVGIGALKRLGQHQAELKSMRTLPDHLGKGVGRAMLKALIERAQMEGLRRLSLETGTSAEFAPAISLYQRHGFVAGKAFAEYANGPHNQCYHLTL